MREKYGGPAGERFGPRLAAEHLASEDGLRVDAETLRRWMLTAGLWSRERRRRRHRRRRERKEHFGEMVQMDGSFHWLEERGPEGWIFRHKPDLGGRGFESRLLYSPGTDGHKNKLRRFRRVAQRPWSLAASHYHKGRHSQPEL